MDEAEDVVDNVDEAICSKNIFVNNNNNIITSNQSLSSYTEKKNNNKNKTGLHSLKKSC